MKGEKNIKNKNVYMIFSIVLAFFAAVVLEACIEQFSSDFLSGDLPWMFTFAASAAAAFFLYRDEFVDGLQKNKKKVFLKQLCICTLLSVLSNVVSFILRVKLLGGSTTTANEASIEATISQIPILAFLTTVVFAPIVEETVFRRILQTWIKSETKWHSSAVAILLSSAVFGLLHSGFSMEVIPYFLDGLMLGIIYEKTDNYALIIGTHMLHNLIATLL